MKGRLKKAQVEFIGVLPSVSLVRASLVTEEAVTGKTFDSIYIYMLFT